MSDLRSEKKTIYSLFSNNNADFLIPDYQRNYSWGIEQCEKLWSDLVAFALPNGNSDNFDNSEEYFLGTILTFKNASKENEVIDGQQRLITFLLLLRAFYESFGTQKNKFRDRIEECIWKLDDNYDPDKSTIKIKSEVSSDDDLEEFKKIVETGMATGNNKSKYAENYRFFQNQIVEFKQSHTQDFLIFIKRIMDNVILLPIEASTQDVALRIFTTLNDRGMPLSDSDIFKAQFYKFYRDKGKQAREKFSRRWKELEENCNEIFSPLNGLDHLFTCYMYWLLAEKSSRTSTLIGLRKFYEQDNYKYLRQEANFEDLVELAQFWEKIYRRDDYFSERIHRQFYILRYSPYIVWYYIVSVYFFKYRANWNEEQFYKFLQKVIAFTWAHAIDKPGIGSIRLPLMNEMVNIFEGKTDHFSAYKFSATSLKTKLNETNFSNQKMITRSFLAWHVFDNEKQTLPSLDTKLEIEHIYARKRNEFEPLNDAENLEKIGNKILLEKRINIRAADYRFVDKKKFYLGYQRNDKKVEGKNILELRQLAENNADFVENDIVERNEKILSDFMYYLKQNDLLK